MDRLKRKIGFYILASLCLLVSIFGVKVGAESFGAVPVSSSIENVEEDDGTIHAESASITTTGNLVTYHEQVYSSNTTLTLDANYSYLFEGCYFKSGTITISNSSSTKMNLAFANCYFANGLFSLSGKFEINVDYCIFNPTAQNYTAAFYDNGIDSSASSFRFSNVLCLSDSNSLYLSDGYGGTTSNCCYVGGNPFDGSAATLISVSDAYNVFNFVSNDSELWSGPWDFEDYWVYVVGNPNPNLSISQLTPINFAAAYADYGSNYFTQTTTKQVVLYDVSKPITAQNGAVIYLSGASTLSSSNNTIASRAGYTPVFSYNYDEAVDGNGNSTMEVNTSCTIYIGWEAKSYTITLDGNGSTAFPITTAGTASISVSYGSSSVPSFSNPVRYGYTLEGWYTAASGGSKVLNANRTLVSGSVTNYVSSGTWAPNANKTLYAQWTAKISKVELYPDNGSSTPQIVYLRNGESTIYSNAAATTTTSITTPTKTGNSLQGWAPAGTTNYVFSSTKVMVNSAYTVVKDGTTSTYVWKHEGDLENKSGTDNALHAIWEPSQITVSLNNTQNGGTGGTTQITPTYGVTTSVSVTAPTKTGYTFQGWYTSDSGGNKVLATNGAFQYVNGYTSSDGKWLRASSTTLYAQYTANTYKLTYNVNPSGEPDVFGTTPNAKASVDMTYDDQFTASLLSAPTWAGHKFEGWFKTSSVNTTRLDTANPLPKLTTANATFANVGTAGTNATIYAKWSINSFTITLDANGGSGNTPSITAQYGSTSVAPITPPTQTGYSFKGWWTSSTGGTQVITTGGAMAATNVANWISGGKWCLSADNTLYAHWEKNKYNVKISHWTWGYNNSEGNNGGHDAYNIGNTSFQVEYGSTVALSASHAVTIPNGYYLGSKFGTSDVNGSWGTYNIDSYTFAMPAKNINIEFDYYPYSYTITYDKKKCEWWCFA